MGGTTKPRSTRVLLLLLLFLRRPPLLLIRQEKAVGGWRMLADRMCLIMRYVDVHAGSAWCHRGARGGWRVVVGGWFALHT